ncbi:MAG: hypothetical protein Satyrvirus18_3 [Satyrvirus sp.]|uniref:Uncharacterized protein n=1 Tax=Satyrvirus sp. TaxID=2487771 RepID=A0A3G5AE17_9VIRU|nr:MAG: hypothetical protein Satyrvirus18_3 [Satyrvirus sp.]
MEDEIDRLVKPLIGKSPFGVEFQICVKLTELMKEAFLLREKSFGEKLAGIKQLVHKAFPINPFEKKEFFDIVQTLHPLSDALDKGAACCRYHSTLFFILGLVSNLGTKHFLHGQIQYRTVYNTVVDGESVYNISTFQESFKDPSKSYIKNMESVFNTPHIHSSDPNEEFFCYEVTNGNPVLHITKKFQALIPQETIERYVQLKKKFGIFE